MERRLALWHLHEAMQGVVGPKPVIPWREYLQNLLSILNQVPAVDLETGDAADETLLKQARDVCDRHLRILTTSRT